MSRPVLAALVAAADLAGRWTSDTRGERGMEIRTEGARIAAVRLWRTDGTVCTQTLSGTFDPAR